MDPVTCCIRYKLAPGKQADFEYYALTWKRIIERLNGTYYGCFLPGEPPPDASHFSFPAIGRDGPIDVATVLFSFDDLAGYERAKFCSVNVDRVAFLSYKHFNLQPAPNCQDL
jgi:hypothetical protein